MSNEQPAKDAERKEKPAEELANEQLENVSGGVAGNRHKGYDDTEQQLSIAITTK